MAEAVVSEEREVKAPVEDLAPETPETPDIEGRARRMGWRPKEEFRGPEEKWVDAGEFVQRGESELPVLRERFRALDDRFSRQEHKLVDSGKKLTDAEKKIDNLTQVLTEFRDYAKSSEERAYNRARRDLESQMRQATAMADTAQYDAAKAELDNLEKARVVAPAPVKPVEPAPPPTPEVAPEVTEWIRDNAWFDRDPTLRAYATALHGEYLKEHPGLSLRDNLAEVSKNVKETFASKFGNSKPVQETKTNPNRDKAATVSTSSPSGNSGNSGKKGKGYGDLPAEAKAACDRYVKEIPNFTKEEYLKMYYVGDDE